MMVCPKVESSLLSEILKNLISGEELQIAERDIWLKFDNGLWIETVQNCYSDTCNCVSHDKYSNYEISEDSALERINQYINYFIEDTQKRIHNTQHLQKWITELKNNYKEM